MIELFDKVKNFILGEPEEEYEKNIMTIMAKNMKMNRK